MDKFLQRVDVGANVLRAAETNFSTLPHANSAHAIGIGIFAEYPATLGDHPIWHIPTPALILSPARAVENFKSIQRAFPGATVGYAMKSNPHPSLLMALSRVDDAWFEVASKAEIQALLDLGVPGSRMFFSNPVKQPAHIAFAVQAGVRLFAYDSEHEVEKLAQFNPPDDPLEVYVRMTVTHRGALWPLTHKFGVEPRRAVQLLKLAESRNLRPVGLAFHVGSQCVRPDTWADALHEIAPAWRMAREAGLSLDLIDIGGGFPAPYTGPTPQPQEIADAVYAVLETCVPGAKRLFLEPGRGVSGSAADMVLEVTGLAQRPDGQTWLYVDGGYFSGLYEIPDGIRPAVRPVIRETRPLRMRTYRLAGPTCDSLDTLFEMRSPVELHVGDRLVLKTAGAYVYSVSSPFNGFPLPEVILADEWMLNLDEFSGIC
ncbi:MAG: type III PLP-dependent enzyme [Anaerolineae bacterium]|nr:type III PLP-dependent enzyme [Anaerolineae bacterium]